MKAWRTEWGGVVSLVYADTRAQARYDTVTQARGCGYPARWVDVKVTRAPRRDGQITKLQQRMCLTW